MQIIYTNSTGQIDLNVYECGSQFCTSGYSYGPAVRDLFIIHYIHSGKGYFEVEKNIYELSAGQGFVIYPGVVIHYKADIKDPWQYSWIGFNGKKAEFYLKKAGLTVQNPVFTCKDFKYIEDCMLKMMQSEKFNNSRETTLIGMLYILLSHHIESAPVNTQLDKRGIVKSDYINKAISFIEVNYFRKISALDISNHVGLDSKYLCSVFKENMKISPYKFLLNMKMDKACELLRYTELCIGDISRSVGYEDTLLFSTMFKRIIGISPSIFRKDREIK